MSRQGIWIDGNYYFYDELDSDAVQELLKPVGGFIYSAENFKALQLTKAPFYIKDYLPQMGKMLLYAPAKSGKSYLCIQMGRCIASGVEWLGLPTVQGRVLYVQFELGEAVLRDRLLQTGKDYENMFVGTSFNLKLDTEGGQKQLLTALDAIRPCVLILDPLYKAIVGDENESLDMRKVLDFLDSVIEAYSCSVVIIHHTGKDESRRGRGSSVLEGWVDSYIRMRKISKVEEDLTIEITPILMRHAAPGEPIQAVMKNYEFEVIGGAGTVKQIVAEYIKTMGRVVEPKEILNSEIGSNNSVYSALKELVSEKKVEQVGRGKYQWKT